MKKFIGRNIHLTYVLFVSSMLFVARQVSLVKDLGRGSIVDSLIARDLEKFRITAQQQPPFPRWKKNDVIQIEPLLGLLDDIIFNFEETPIVYHNRESSEQLYIVDSAGIWTSRALRRKCVLTSEQGRFAPTEQAMLAAVNMLHLNTNTTKWPRLREALAVGQGFPFLHYYGDYSSCNHEHHNFLWENNSVTLPLFTCSARLNDCNHAFPFPNYEVIWSARASSKEWSEYFEANNLYHPWESKLPKIVWRGRLTGHTNLTQNARWKLHQFAVQYNHTGLFDVGVVGLPPHHRNVNISLADYIDRHQYQSYMGILDIDGNSWSSRFASLLCLNSVVLKVEPEQVDYFFVNHHVTPWVHYIPVKRDLSDLLEKASYATKHPDRVRKIVKAANEWCRTTMLEDKIAEDMLDIWNSYLNLFEKNWTEAWKRAKPKFMDSYEMESLPVLDENAFDSGGTLCCMMITTLWLVLALVCLITNA